MIKKASDKFIKEKVRGGKELCEHSKEASAQKQNKKARRMLPGSDEIIAAYPGSHADKAASPNVKASDQDLGLGLGQKKK
jgi:hypothetical protein